MKGDNINRDLLDNNGQDNSLEINFRASARGWGAPINLTLFGPFRSWE